MDLQSATAWPQEKELRAALDRALLIVDRNMEVYKGIFPGNMASGGRYRHENNVSWISGFWPGILWLSYELTGDEKYADCAEGYVDSFYDRIDKKENVAHHDMGFLYSPSCVAAYMLRGNEKAKKAAIMAADHLCKRFMKKGNFLNAWSDIDSVTPENNFYIIDCLMNTPLLYWASKETGDSSYAEIADKHIETTTKTIIREDNSTFHSYLFDMETGAPIRGITRQGFSDSSTWSRGQAWGVSGFAMNYVYTHSCEQSDCFRRVTDYFISHLPKDMVPYWDMYFREGEEPRDSSAAAIAVCGILEMEKHITDSSMARYSEAGAKMLRSLIENYAADPNADENDGILLHGTGSVPHDLSVDQPLIFGDYFYLEAITRLLKKDWKMYW